MPGTFLKGLTYANSLNPYKNLIGYIFFKPMKKMKCRNIDITPIYYTRCQCLVWIPDYMHFLLYIWLKYTCYQHTQKTPSTCKGVNILSSQWLLKFFLWLVWQINYMALIPCTLKFVYSVGHKDVIWYEWRLIW